MATRLLDKRWPWLAAGVLIVVAFLSTVVEIRVPGDWDSRPLGSVEDIEALRDRDDLNLLFIVVDTLRAERLGSYGYARETMPEAWIYNAFAAAKLDAMLSMQRELGKRGKGRGTHRLFEKCMSTTLDNAQAADDDRIA